MSALDPSGSQAPSADVKAGDLTTELTVFHAYELAEKFNLPPGQVSDSWKLFKRYDSQGLGVLSNQEFQLVLRAVLREQFPRARDVPRDLFNSLIREDDQTNFIDFLTWQTKNSFNQELLVSADQQQIREITRNLGLPLPEVEAIKKKFDSFDLDGSGVIDFTEFFQLLRLLLGASSDLYALPITRARAFWRSVDIDGNGSVEFAEFVYWYASNFDVKGNGADRSPLEDYYHSIRPVPFELAPR